MRWGASALLFLSGVAKVEGAGEFFDDFERPDGPPAGWLTTQGSAEIRSGELLLESSGVEGWTWIDTATFEGDITLEVDLRFDPSDTSPDIGRHGGIMLFASERTTRYSSSMNGYTIDWIDRATDHGYRLHKWTAGLEAPIVPDLSAPDPNPGTTWKITVSGPTISLEIDGEPKLSVDDPDYRQGAIGFWGYLNGQHIHIDNVAAGTAPVARFSVDPARGPTPLEARFDGSTSVPAAGAITSWAWSFGDGETGSGAEVTHVYTKAGRYTARLTVKDAGIVPGSAFATVTALFPSGDVAPWTSADVGAPAFPGGARLEGECLSVAGGGTDIAGAEDEFHFVHQETSGDTRLTARVRAAEWGGTGSRAGVMLRESLDPTSAFAFMSALRTVSGVQGLFVSRLGSGDRATLRTHALQIVPPDCFLRIERIGADFAGSISTDGAAWIEVRRTTLEAPPASMLAGLALSAGDRSDVGLFSIADFCEVALDGPAGGVPFHRGDADGDGSLNITDGVSILNFLFTGGATPTCLETANSNDDESVDVTDGVHVLNYLFLAGPAPAPPGPVDAPCGPDPPGSVSDLGCDAYGGC